jgi:hypothetical protein
MVHHRRYALLLVLSALITTPVLAADSPGWSPAAALPRDAYVAVEIPRPHRVFEPLFQPQVLRAVTSHPEFVRRRHQPDFLQMMNLVEYFEQRFETDLQGLLQRLLGGGITLGIGPGEQVLVILEAEDEKVLSEVHDFLLMIARNQDQGQNDSVRSAEYRGVTGWSFGPGQTHAILGNRLLWTNQPQALTAAIDRIQQADLPNLASLPGYQQSRKSSADRPVASVFARMDVLKQLPAVAAALDQQNNPLLTLLLAPLMQAWKQSDWLALDLDLEDLTLTMTVTSDGRADDGALPTGFARSTEATDGAMPNLNVPRQIAGISFYRDLHRFYTAKDDLFPQRTSGLIFFENMMGIFFTGRDLTEEVLAELHPEVRMVIAQQEYPAEIGMPAPQLPGVALVFRMKRPDHFSLVAEEAWQKALGLINFTRGQQAEPGLILDKPTHAGVKYTMAAFLPPEKSDQAPAEMRFNFQPALAMLDGFLILSSTDALARDLIDALQQEAKEGAAPVAGNHSIAQLNGSSLASIVQANRETLIRQNMVEKGHSREQAEAEIGMLAAVVGSIGRVQIAAGGEQAERLTIELELDLQP